MRKGTFAHRRVKNRQAVSQNPTISMPPTQSPAPNIQIQPMVAPAPEPGDKLVRGGATAGRPGQIVSAANRWRENYNPLRRLTMRRVVELFELGQRGDTAYLQWTYRFIERRNPTLSGLISRCEAPLAGFDWSIKKKAILPKGVSKAEFVGSMNRRGIKIRNLQNRVIEAPQELNEPKLKELAEAQLRSLDAAYNAIDNLRDALLHLHLGFFRGYSHLQKHRNPDGDVYHLEPLMQWCICRDGLAGNWWWNPDSRSTSAPLQFLGADFCIGGKNLPREDFIILECERPINEVGLVDTVRRGLCEKDWDAFIEIYGVPGGVVEMPPQVPPGRESEYQQAAKEVAEGAAGAIPSGSKYYPNDHPRGVDPFTPRMKHLDEALILAGTGGMLTMMTESHAGTGGQMRGSSRVHDKTFGEIADGRARKIGELFQREFDAEVLKTHHSGEPQLVYFDFGAEEEEDISALCQNVLNLKQANYTVEPQWLSEKSGIPLSLSAQPAVQPTRPGEPPEPGENKPGEKVTNRDSAGTPSPGEVAATISDMLKPLSERLAAIEQALANGVSMTTIHSMVAKLLNDYPHIAKVIEADNSLAQKFSPMLKHSLVKGITHKPVAA